MQKLKQEKGITLIALIVTIIILLILASVTISILLGENGLLNTVQEAAIKQKMAEETELIKVSYAGLDIDYRVYDTEIKAKKLEEEINHSKAAKVEEVESMPEGGMLVDNGVTEGILCKVTMEYEYYIYLPGVALEAGLWKNGSLVYSWQELKDIHWLTVDEAGNAKLINDPALIDGDLVVHQEATSLSGVGAPYTNLLSIKTLGSLTSLGGFHRSGLVWLDLNCEGINLSYTFAQCESLTEVNIKGNVANLNGTFANCTNLTEVNISGNIERMDSTFTNASVEKVKIIGNIESMSSTFNSCNLTQINIEGNVTNMNGTFSNCAGLEEAVFNCSIDIIEGPGGAFPTTIKKIVFNKHVGDLKRNFSTVEYKQSRRGDNI